MKKKIIYVAGVFVILAIATFNYSLNVQKADNGGSIFTSLAALAQTEQGTGEAATADGEATTPATTTTTTTTTSTTTSECKCTAYDYDNVLLEIKTCTIIWQQKLTCTYNAPGKCCKSEWLKTCTGSLSLPGTVSCAL